MADPVTVVTPDYTGIIDQNVFQTPLGGPEHPISYMDQFPESVYNKGIDSHLVRFMYATLGPAGVGWLRKNYLQARLLLEDYGIETFDLDGFYGDPLRFGRILDEMYEDDPSGLLDRATWEAIRAKDAKYRSRAIDYVNGARAGNTPLGMRLVARSGLGHEVEVIERYMYLYDQLTDDKLDLPNLGLTKSTEEMTIIPRREVPQSESQTITISGTATGGSFTLFFPLGNEAANTTAALAYNATRFTIQLALEALANIAVGDIIVSGGPLPTTPITINFTRTLAYKDVPQLQVKSSLVGAATIGIATDRSGIDQIDEVVQLSPRDQHNLREALDNIRPVTSIVTFNQGRGTKTQQTWNSVFATGTYNEVVRYVTGQQAVMWPARDGVQWIERGIERQAPRAQDNLSHHYHGFHNVGDIRGYTELALTDPAYLSDRASTANYASEHIGPFTSYQQTLYPVLQTVQAVDFKFTADQALADYTEPLTVATSTSSETPTQLINGIYPVGYNGLSGVPPIKYKDDQFWASLERATGDEYLEIDLGTVQAVNYIYFEATRKPFDIEVCYDLLDMDPARQWTDISPDPHASFTSYLSFDPGARNPWGLIEFYFNNGLGTPAFTRFLRIKFARRIDINSPFTDASGNQLPYSIEVRNLRIGRSVV